MMRLWQLLGKSDRWVCAECVLACTPEARRTAARLRNPYFPARTARPPLPRRLRRRCCPQRPSSRSAPPLRSCGGRPGRTPRLEKPPPTAGCRSEASGALPGRRRNASGTAPAERGACRPGRPAKQQQRDARCDDVRSGRRWRQQSVLHANGPHADGSELAHTEYARGV